MGHQRNEVHAQQVESWKKNQMGLSSSELTQSFIRAIQAVRKRSLATLSGVTVAAVVDRTLIECKEKFPALSEVTSNSDGLDFSKFIYQIQNSKQEEIHKALEELLIELLDIFGKITAEILTKYLHQELMSVTANPPLENSEPPAMHKLGLVRNREKK